MANPPRSDRRLVAAMCYLFTPVVPLVAMRGMRDDDEFAQRHARQGLIWAVPFLLMLVATVALVVVFIQQSIVYICLMPLVLIVPMIPGAVLASRVYFGGDIKFPGV